MEPHPLPPETALAGGHTGWVIRPRAASRVWFGVALAGGLVAFRALVDSGRPRALRADVIEFVPLVFVALIVLAVYLRNARLTIERDRVETIDFWGRVKAWPKDAVARVDRFSTYGGYGTSYAVFVGQDGKKLFSLSAPFWELGIVNRVCRQVGIHVTGGFRDIVSPYRLNDRVPGMTTWRSWALGFAIVALIVGLVVVSFVVTGPSSGG